MATLFVTSRLDVLIRFAESSVDALSLKEDSAKAFAPASHLVAICAAVWVEDRGDVDNQACRKESEGYEAQFS